MHTKQRGLYLMVYFSHSRRIVCDYSLKIIQYFPTKIVSKPFYLVCTNSQYVYDTHSF
jgi:hypothetical protein